MKYTQRNLAKLEKMKAEASAYASWISKRNNLYADIRRKHPRISPEEIMMIFAKQNPDFPASPKKDTIEAFQRIPKNYMDYMEVGTLENCLIVKL